MTDENIPQPSPKENGGLTSPAASEIKTEENDTKGIIYVLINEYMPDLVKIGKTQDLKRRMRDLDSTGVPLPFECFYACTVDEHHFVEQKIHDAFADHRVRPRREFFRISPRRVVSALKLREIDDVTPTDDIIADNDTQGEEEDQKALNKARNQRPPFNFDMAEIPIGATLTFLNKDGVTAEVVDRRQIKYNGTITSLSAAATEVLGYSYAVSGTLYWMFENESLTERRQRLESDE